MQAKPIEFEYFDQLEDDICAQRITAAKRSLGKRAVILAHHYQRADVYKHADLTGDSLKLSFLAAQTDADYLVFCGVHFMAEVADILSSEKQIAVLPDLSAGCSMADMANLSKVTRAWQELSEILDADEKVLFFPDQHLGRWSGHQLGIPMDQMVVWDFDEPMGGLTPEQIKKARIILWKGYCSVHQMFQPQHILRFRNKHPDGLVISHPECSYEVCQASDYVGSTEYIINTIRDSKSGTNWLVGTELNLVSRIAEEFKPQGKIVQFMSPMVCMCSTMARIDPQHLAWSLENLVAGNVVNQIKISGEESKLAKRALDRMLEIS